MIDASEVNFPNNILLALKECLKNYDDEIDVFLRPIRQGDPIQAWGLTASMWTPDDNSWEFMGNQGLSSPTINQYVIGLQAFNQDMDSERGLQTSATMAGIARNLLSRDPNVRVALLALTSTEFGFTERVTRFQVQGQRFLSNEIEGAFLYLTNLEFLIETEIEK